MRRTNLRRRSLVVATSLALLGITAGPAAAAVHDEAGDAGQLRATAQVVAADPLTAIRGSAAPNTADMYRVCSAGGPWSASTSTDHDDPMLWFFNAAGTRMRFNDDYTGLESFISGDIVAGAYYVAIAQYAYAIGPHSADEWPGIDDPEATEMPYTIDVTGLQSCETEAPHITTSATTADDQPYTQGEWTDQAVTVAFACVDNSGGAGVDETASTLIASKTVGGEGEHSVASAGTCADNAGNTAEAVVYAPVRIDRTAPEIQRTSRTAANAAGWNAGDVTVTWSCTDHVSGVVDDAVSKTVSGDGADQDVTASCQDRAGNSASATEQHINIDAHAPHITASATTADEAPYTAGTWTSQDVRVAFACADGDGGSGIDTSASDLTAARTVSDEGEHSVASAGTCADHAGNTAPAVSFGPVKIDRTGPVLTFTGADTYALDDQIEIGCSASDSLAGVAETCTGLSAPAQSYAAGAHTITRSATDRAGNQTTSSATFTVKAKTTPSSLCALTKQYVQSSAGYDALSPTGKAALDKNVATTCQPLAAIVPGISPQLKSTLVTVYKIAVSSLAAARWLTAEQATTLKKLAGTL